MAASPKTAHSGFRLQRSRYLTSPPFIPKPEMYIHTLAFSSRPLHEAVGADMRYVSSYESVLEQHEAPVLRRSYQRGYCALKAQDR